MSPASLSHAKSDSQLDASPSIGPSAGRQVAQRDLRPCCVQPTDTPEEASRALSQQLAELEEFAGSAIPSTTGAMPHDLAAFEADLMMLDPPTIKAGGVSRLLPKGKKNNTSAATAKAKKQAAAPRSCSDRKAQAKCSEYKLATSRAYCRAKKTAIDGGANAEEAAQQARAAYRKAAGAFPPPTK